MDMCIPSDLQAGQEGYYLHLSFCYSCGTVGRNIPEGRRCLTPRRVVAPVFNNTAGRATQSRTQIAVVSRRGRDDEDDHSLALSLKTRWKNSYSKQWNTEKQRHYERDIILNHTAYVH